MLRVLSWFIKSLFDSYFRFWNICLVFNFISVWQWNLLKQFLQDGKSDIFLKIICSSKIIICVQCSANQFSFWLSNISWNNKYTIFVQEYTRDRLGEIRASHLQDSIYKYWFQKDDLWRWRLVNAILERHTALVQRHAVRIPESFGLGARTDHHGSREKFILPNFK